MIFKSREYIDIFSLSVSTCPLPDVAGRSSFVDGCYLATVLATDTDQAQTSPLSQQKDFW